MLISVILFINVYNWNIFILPILLTKILQQKEHIYEGDTSKVAYKRLQFFRWFRILGPEYALQLHATVTIN
jgi:hypothetical protein